MIIKRVLLKMLSNDEGFPTFSKMKFYIKPGMGNNVL